MLRIVTIFQGRKGSGFDLAITTVEVVAAIDIRRPESASSRLHAKARKANLSSAVKRSGPANHIFRVWRCRGWVVRREEGGHTAIVITFPTTTGLRNRSFGQVEGSRLRSRRRPLENHPPRRRSACLRSPRLARDVTLSRVCRKPLHIQSVEPQQSAFSTYDRKETDGFTLFSVTGDIFFAAPALLRSSRVWNLNPSNKRKRL